MKFQHNLNPGDFTGSHHAAEAFHRLNTGDWKGFELRELNYAFASLMIAHRHGARNPKLKPSAPEWKEFRSCLHALGRVFALKWLERGEDVFQEKLDFYRRMARLERANATDELFYQAFLRLDESRHSATNETR